MLYRLSGCQADVFTSKFGDQGGQGASAMLEPSPAQISCGRAVAWVTHLPWFQCRLDPLALLHAGFSVFGPAEFAESVQSSIGEEGLVGVLKEGGQSGVK